MKVTDFKDAMNFDEIKRWKNDFPKTCPAPGEQEKNNF